MKRFLILLLALILAGSLVACGETGTQNAPGFSQPSQEENPSAESHASGSPTDSTAEPAPENENANVLIACFSATGNTQEIALSLQEILGGDYFAIVPAEPYTDEDLNYSNDGCRANREQNDPDARPAISSLPDNPEEYDVVFLGYPIWWGQAPKIMVTFLESCDLGDTVIVPFCTSGSSGIDGSMDALRALAPEATWLEGRRFPAGADAEELTQWVEELDLPALSAETN